ncbi:MAG: beta-ketoacyl synthase N-terminal-like domain-containing protein [Luteolibacter sp.]
MNPFPLHIHGHGAVSPAGCGSDALYRAVVDGIDIPVAEMTRELIGKTLTYRHRAVDRAALRPMMPKHPRLRRASDVTKFAVAAAQEAIGAERVEKIHNRELRVGIVVSFMNGCVNYTNRFFGEVLDDPTLASPILFPETVFNAPAGHVATFLGCDGPVYTLIGDSAGWFSALCIAEEWISGGLVDGCLVISAEETDWLTMEALGLYARGLIASEGAAAIYVEANPSAIAIANLNGPFCYTNARERRTAIREAWAAANEDPATLLIDGLTGMARADRDEADVLADFDGPRLSPAITLGEGMGVRCGFQTITAIRAIESGQPSATILASGGNQHAYSATLTRNISS